MRAYLLILLFAEIVTLSAAPTVLRGKVVNIESNAPIANTEIRFRGHGTTRTDSYGVFAYEIHNQNLATIELDKIGNFEILYPKDGIIPIPRNPDVEVLIYIGKDQMKNFIDQVLNDVGEINKKIGELSQLKTEFAAYNQTIQDQYKQLQVQQILLAEQQRFIKEKAKAEILPGMAGAFDHYLSRMRDLRDELRRQKDQVFNDTGKHIHILQRRMDGYSEAYEALNQQREPSLIYVENYWDDPFLVAELRGLYKTTLDDFHITKVLPYNRLMDNITRYNERAKGRLKKPQLMEEIEKYAEELSHNIDIIERDKVRVMQELKDY